MQRMTEEDNAIKITKGTQTQYFNLKENKFSLIEYFQDLFNIDNKDFFKRIFYSLIFFLPKLAVEIENNPDFYSTFWISIIMVFTFTFKSNLVTYFRSLNYTTPSTTTSVSSSIASTTASTIGSTTTSATTPQAFSLNLTIIAKSIFFFLFITIIIPLLLSIIMESIEVILKKKNLICIYGYSYFIVLLTSIITLVNNQIVVIIFFIYAIIANIFSLLIWIRKEAEINKTPLSIIGYIIIIWVQSLIFFMLWFIYYK